MLNIKKSLTIVLAGLLFNSACIAQLNVAKNDTKTLKVGAESEYINVMGAEMPALPQFPNLPKKAGKARGYVKDWNGNPLAGAAIGIRGVGLVGTTAGANATTDANGYYEIKVPWGTADFYAAGYTISYGDGKAAIGLHPADGQLGGFASNEGAVENFVLLPYGITSKDALSESPRVSSTYYGGSIYLSYGTRRENDCCVPLSYLSENTEVIITLTTAGETFDGATRTFIIRKNVGSGGGLKIHNIPIGIYKIAVRQADGKPVKISQNVPLADSPFAMQPRETASSAKIHFYSDGAKAAAAIPASGKWTPLEISLEKP